MCVWTNIYHIDFEVVVRSKLGINDFIFFLQFLYLYESSFAWFFIFIFWNENILIKELGWLIEKEFACIDLFFLFNPP